MASAPFQSAQEMSYVPVPEGSNDFNSATKQNETDVLLSISPSPSPSPRRSTCSLTSRQQIGVWMVIFFAISLLLFLIAGLVFIQPYREANRIYTKINRRLERIDWFHHNHTCEFFGCTCVNTANTPVFCNNMTQLLTFEQTCVATVEFCQHTPNICYYCSAAQTCEYHCQSKVDLFFQGVPYPVTEPCDNLFQCQQYWKPFIYLDIFYRDNVPFHPIGTLQVPENWELQDGAIALLEFASLFAVVFVVFIIFLLSDFCFGCRGF
jgi:hypothetical protein